MKKLSSLYFQSNPLVQISIFILLSTLIWLDVFVFFVRDDWTYIMNYYDKIPFSSFIFDSHGAHFIPLHKLVYYFEIILFGHNTLLFQVLSIIAWALFCYTLSKIFEQLSLNKYLIFSLSILLCIHPNFADIMYWVFQQCIIFHLLFQSLAILCYLKHVHQKNNNHLKLFYLFLILQNFFFANGILFPALFITYNLFRERNISFQTIVLFIIQVIFVILQKLYSQQSIHLFEVFANAWLSVQTFFNIFLTSVTRLFFIKSFGHIFLYILSGSIFIYLLMKAFKKNKNMILFSVAYLLISSLGISIGRTDILNYNIHQMQYYYTLLLFPPISLIVIMGLSSIQLKKHNNIISLIPVIYFAGMFIINIHVKKIYSYRNFKNKEAINNAMVYGKKNYYPFDDAMYFGGKNIYQDKMLNQSVQNSLTKSFNFELDSTIKKYLGENRINEFLKINNKKVNSYIYLKENSLFNIDINYEKK